MKRTLHAEFLAAYYRTKHKANLALLVGVRREKISALMNATDLRVTPRTVQHLANLATTIGYSGEMFSDEVAE